MGIWWPSARTFLLIWSNESVLNEITPSDLDILRECVTSPSCIRFEELNEAKFDTTVAANRPPISANCDSSAVYSMQSECGIVKGSCRRIDPASITFGCKSIIETPVRSCPWSKVYWIGAGPRHSGSSDGCILIKGISSIILGGIKRENELTMPME